MVWGTYLEENCPSCLIFGGQKACQDSLGHFFPEEFYRGASLLHLYYSFRHHTTLLNEKLLPEKNATECSFECVCVCGGGGGGQCPNERGFWFLGASLTSLVRKRNDVPNPAWAWKPLSSPWHVNLPQFRTGHNTSRYGQVEVDSTWMNEKKNLNHQKFRRICWI